MAIITRTANKTKFETGDVPTQNDFIDFIDSVFHFGSDTLENVPQGTNRKWVTPTQISAWNAKANATHNHSISDVTSLVSTLALKKNVIEPISISANEIQTLGIIPMDSFFNVYGVLPAGGMELGLGTLLDTLPTAEWTMIFDNNTGGAVGVVVGFDYVNTKTGVVDYKTTSSGVVSVGVSERLVVKGSFVPNSDGSSLIFVGIIDSKIL